MPLDPKYKETRGKFKAPKYRAFGFKDGIPFTLTFQSLKACKKLEQEEGVSKFNYVVI